MVVPPKPRFMVMDITDPYLDWCAGIYVAESRNSGGFDYSQAAEDPATIEKKGRDGAAKMKALKDAADKGPVLALEGLTRCLLTADSSALPTLRLSLCSAGLAWHPEHVI